MEQQTRHILTWLVVLSGFAVLSFWARPLIPVDETRYISVAWEMWLRGDFLVPFKNGLPYSHKPPLLFWMINLGWGVFGVNEWWPRILPSLFSFASLLLTVRIAKRLWPEQPRIAWLAPGLLLSTLLWLFFSTAVMFDIMLAFWTLVGVLGLLRALAQERFGWTLLVLSLAAGTLTKGPVILLHVLPLAVLAPWWSDALGRGKRRAWYGRVLLSLLVAVCLVLMWAIPAALHGGSVYANEIFWGQTAGRMAKSFAHKREWWWYLPLMPVILFPWLFWPATWKGVGRLVLHQRDGSTRMLLAWLLPVFLAFWLISGKQVHYLLPLFPAFMLLLARGLQEPVRVSVAGLMVPALVMLALAMVLIILPGKAGSHRIPVMAGDIPAWTGYLVLLLAVLIPLLGRSGDIVRQARVLQAAGVTFLVIIMLLVIHPLTRNQDINAFSQHVARLQRQGIVFAHVGTYHDQFQFPGRLRKPVQVIRRDQLRRWVASNPAGWVLVYRSATPGPLYRVARARMMFRNKWLLLVKSSDLAQVNRWK